IRVVLEREPRAKRIAVERIGDEEVFTIVHRERPETFGGRGLPLVEMHYIVVGSFIGLALTVDMRYGIDRIQKPIAPEATPPPPPNSIYEKKWSFTLPASVQESLNAPGMPKALLEYRKGWDGWSGTIPTDRKDMWTIFYYLNTIRDSDRDIEQI